MLTQRDGVPSMVSVEVTKKIRRLINNRDQPPLLVGKERTDGWGSLKYQEGWKKGGAHCLDTDKSVRRAT